MALSADIRFVATNSVGETIGTGDLTIDFDFYKGDGAGGLSFTDVTQGSNGADILSGNEAVIASYSPAGQIGLVGGFTGDLSGGASPDGVIELYLELSHDGGVSYFRHATPIGVLRYTGTAESKSVAIIS